ncbi:MAG: DUF1993 domain-containing protein [Beijerinckiaceae bacterium]
MSLHAASVPVFVQMLRALETVLKKAEAHAEAKKIAPEVMLGLRLSPDMFALTRQVQVACDFAKNTSGRLAAVELPKFADEEKTFAELYERIGKTVAFVESLPASAFDGAETRAITFPIGGKPYTMDGAPYFNGFAMPNFYFHVSAAYMILRENGVALNKRDFLGAVPGLQLG